MDNKMPISNFKLFDFTAVVNDCNTFVSLAIGVSRIRCTLAVCEVLHTDAGGTSSSGGGADATPVTCQPHIRACDKTIAAVVPRLASWGGNADCFCRRDWYVFHPTCL